MRTETKLGYEEAIAAVTEALKAEGFGVLTEIDVKATFKKKLDIDFQRYVILGACNPVLANKALTIDREVGLLLPCNVIVYEEPEGAVVSIIDPNAMMGVVPGGKLDEVADEARARLERVAAALAG
ncbi:MAG: DUF302 domain-containing protein [Ardenticatenales bacterium]|nr:DUF302 domain-containing protein [Ardenticatenales bacterium]